MKDVHTLTSLSQLKALADPLRRQILEGFCGEPKTTKQLAQEMGEKPTKLYHHVNTLETEGLITLVKTRPNRGTTEKYYQAVAHKFAVAQGLLSMGPAEATSDLQRLVLGTLQAGLTLAQQRLDAGRLMQQAGGVPLIAGHPTIRTSAARAAELSQQLQAVVQAFQEAHEEDGAVTYNLTLAFFPVTPSPP